MSSFLDRLKKKDIVPGSLDDAKKEKVTSQQNQPPAPPAPPAEQLKVDIFQSPSAIIVYSQIAGAGIHDFSVSIEGDNDVVIIKGQRTRPNGDFFSNPAAEG